MTAPTATPDAGTTTAPDAETTGRRVEEVLDRLAGGGSADAGAAAEELVRALMDFYGAGLARIMRLVGDSEQFALLGDELVASLLVLHDLHPENVRTRIGRALDTVRAQHPVELAGFDAESGELRLRSGASGGCGCPSTTQAAQQAIENALSCFAPEVTSVRLETAGSGPEPTLLQISRRPPTTAMPS
ncbi:hypothetical protein AB0D04_06960 [Streptomyces sp. NPDC048483]|uniref:hypothetical protein n=1 Tax=Streptomyces sp. NPDC048483 TaxID=3154927 RepID=UPI00343595E7